MPATWGKDETAVVRTLRIIETDYEQESKRKRLQKRQAFDRAFAVFVTSGYISIALGFGWAVMRVWQIGQAARGK